MCLICVSQACLDIRSLQVMLSHDGCWPGQAIKGTFNVPDSIETAKVFFKEKKLQFLVQCGYNFLNNND